MPLTMNYLKALLILAVVLLGLTFHLRNGELVTVNYYFGSNELPLSLALAAALFLGALLGVLACLPRMVALRRAKTQAKGQQQAQGPAKGEEQALAAPPAAADAPSSNLTESQSGGR